METISHSFTKRHNEIRKALHGIDRISLEERDEKRILLEDLQRILNAHLSAEESVLYRKVDELGDQELSIMVARSREEHEFFNYLVDRMNQSWPNTPAWKALFDIFRDNVEMYLRREEARLLPISDRVFPGNQVQDIVEKTERTEEDWRSGRQQASAKFWEVPQ